MPNKTKPEEIKCRHCGDVFPKERLLDGLCQSCYSDEEEDHKHESKL